LLNVFKLVQGTWTPIGGGLPKGLDTQGGSNQPIATTPIGFISEGEACFVFAADPSGATAFYRLRSSRIPFHFFTTSLAERDNAIANLNSVSEGIACFVLPVQIPGTVPLHRLVHADGDHFFTISDAERDTAIAQFGYQSEGDACFVFPTQTQGTQPLHRLRNTATGEHFYTTSDAERDNAIAKTGAIYFAVSGNFSAAVFQSVDGGNNWSDISSAHGISPHVDHHSLLFVDSALYDGNDGGIWRLIPRPQNEPGAGTWEHLNTTGLQTIQVQGMSLQPRDPTTILVGSQDNGTALGHHGVWNSVQGSDRGRVRFDPGSSTAYSVTYGSFDRSRDSGASWEKINLPNGEFADGIMQNFEVDPFGTTAVMVVGLHGTWSSLNEGASWHQIAPALTGEPNSVTAMAFSSDPEKSYLAFSNGSIFVTRNGRGNVADWSEISKGTTWGGTIVAMVTDPGSPDDLYLATNNGPSIWRKIDGGNSVSEGIACFVLPVQIPGTVPLHRLVHADGDHFFTISDAERDTAIAQFGYQSEGDACFVFPTQTQGTQPLHRLRNTATGEHFYTTSDAERDNAIANLNFISEGEACFVFVADPSGATAFYRLRSSRIPFHFFTTSLAERDNGIAGWRNLTSDLPSIGITALALAQKANGPNIFVGTPSGVYACQNPAIPGWQRFGGGLPYVRVSDLDYQSTTDLLAAGTYGRGIFTIVVGQ
jgi:hypothetical protein